MRNFFSVSSGKKFFSELVPSGLGLYFAIFFSFQILIRFLNLEFFGIWRDETATLYFTSHLKEVFLGDSHSWFYYALLKPLSWIDPMGWVTFRWFHALMSFGLYVLILVRSRKVLSDGEWMVFHGLYGLHPLVFGLARLARPYGLLLDLSTLLIFEFKHFAREQKRLSLFLSALCLCLVHPFGVLPVFVEWFFFQRENKKILFKTLLPAVLPIVLYYGLKFLLDSRPTGYVNWIKSSAYIFLSDLNSMLLGSYFPFSETLSYEVANLIMAGFMFWFIYSLIFFGRSKNIVKFLCLYVGLFGLVSLLSLKLDLRINRYYVFLLPYFLLALGSTLALKEKVAKIAALVGAAFLVFNVSFFSAYFTPKVSLGSTIEVAKHLGQQSNVPVMACGYQFHNWYFAHKGLKVCTSVADLNFIFQTQSGFIYLFLDNQLSALLALMDNRSMIDTQTFPDARIVTVSPKRVKP